MKLYNQLERFREYCAKNPFEVEEIVPTENQKFFRGELAVDRKRHLPGGESFVNIGYTLSGSRSKVLSNLFPYTFDFRGNEVASIEGVIQGLKIKDPEVQAMCWGYSGLNSSFLKAHADRDWAEEGILFWQGEAIDRHSEEYTQFIEELYVSAAQNRLYEKALLAMPSEKYLLHSIGKVDPHETSLTRGEFETQLNQLRNFVKDDSEI